MAKVQRLTDEEREFGKALAEHAKLDPSIVLEDYNVQSRGEDTVTVIFEVIHKMPRAEFEALLASVRTRK